MAAPVIDTCGFCQRPLRAISEKIVQVNACQHQFHSGCFFNQQSTHNKITKKFQEILCPEKGCRQSILKAPKAEFSKKIFEKITVKPNPKVVEREADKSVLKKVAYAICVFCVTLIAVAISPTWFGLGAGLVASIPCAWLTGKFLDKTIKN